MVRELKKYLAGLPGAKTGLISSDWVKKIKVSVGKMSELSKSRGAWKGRTEIVKTSTKTNDQIKISINCVSGLGAILQL